MKLSKLLIIAIAASVSLFSACTAEDDYPARHELVLQLGLGDAETRATPNGTWTVGDYIAVKVGNTVKQYEITSTDGEAHGKDAGNTFCWEDLGVSSVKVTAWSSGKVYYENFTSPITVQTDQRSDEDFTASDFLYASEKTITNGGNANLVFYHQMYRLVLSIRMDDDTETIESVTIGDIEDEDYPNYCYLGGIFTEPTYNQETEEISNYGIFDFEEVGNETYGVIIAHKDKEDDNGNIIYSAIMPPCTFYEVISININLTSGSKCSCLLGTNESPIPDFKEGKTRTYNIRVRNKELTVTSTVGNAISVKDWRQ